MKRIIAVLLLLSVCLGLGACGAFGAGKYSMEKFKENLGSGYKKTSLDADELEDYADMLDLDLDIDDYGVKSAIEATHKKKGIAVVIIACKSNKKASALSDDMSDVLVTLGEQYGGDYAFKIAVRNQYVLCGEARAVNAALDE